jgi:hypothetical protein
MQHDPGNRARKSIPFLAKSNRAPSKHNSQHFGYGPNDDHDPHTPIRTERAQRPEAVVVNNANLEKMVEDLGAKIAELTAIVLAQQGSAPEESL